MKIAYPVRSRVSFKELGRSLIILKNYYLEFSENFIPRKSMIRVDKLYIVAIFFNI